MLSCPRLPRTPGVRAVLSLALLIAGWAGPPIAHAGLGDHDRDRPLRPTPRDPLVPLVRRMERYLRRNEADGVTMDWRYQVSPSEEIRQTVVCQLLAYVELDRIMPRPSLRNEVVRHADFLIARLDEIRSHTPFDGMLAYSLLAAYEITGEGRFLDAGWQVTREMLAIPTSECVLNGGLMVAMATGEYWRLTGDALAGQKTHDILLQLVPYQNGDGSFPHWCAGSRDIHYTGWMSMELIHLQRLVDDSHLAPMLQSATAFLAGRIGPEGRSIYEEPCQDGSGCTLYYYSRATGCGFDYDTRGWTVEPAYCGLAFDHAGSPQYWPAMRFLLSLEHGGTFADLYDYWPAPSDPEYPWTIADTSVVNMSIIFWALTTAIADRARRGIAQDLWLDDEGAPDLGPAVFAARPLGIEPNPAPGWCALSVGPEVSPNANLTIYDAGGRKVRVLELGAMGGGPRAARWDGRDLAGRKAPSGVYFARLEGDGARATRRFVLFH